MKNILKVLFLANLIFGSAFSFADESCLKKSFLGKAFNFEAGNGTQSVFCDPAKDTASDFALEECYLAGNSKCKVIATRVVSYSSDVWTTRCEMEAVVVPTDSSKCNPKTKIFHILGKSSGYGHSCDEAKNFSRENALFDCYAKGLSCNHKITYIKESNGDHCTAGTVVHGL